MKSFFTSAHSLALFCALVLFGFMAFQMPGVDIKTDEQTIRSLVEKQNQHPEQHPIKFTEASIFVSGAYERPFIRNQEGPDIKQRQEQLQKERLNFKARAAIERLVVAKSGDMAYEFGNGTLDWDKADGSHTHLDNSYLRVWRKNGQDWLVDAFFARPNNIKE